MAAAQACQSCGAPIPEGRLFCPSCGAPSPTEISDAGRYADEAERRAQLQRALGAGFELRDRIGHGGFGEVWSARDVRLKRDVAVKVLLSQVAADPGIHIRFAREAQAAAGLRHPNIIPIYSVGEAEGLTFVVMPLVQGESLRAAIQRDGALPIADARRIVAEAALALEAAHSAGIIHRDVKPENIMLEGQERRVVLMDFGIARAVEPGATRLTGTGLVVGTPQYMSPEQATADTNIDHRADIYSLGVVAYEALTGRPPFSADSTRDLLLHHLTTHPRDPRALRADIPPDVSEAVMKCLAKAPSDRWASAGALAGTLQPQVTVTVQSPLRWLGHSVVTGVRRARARIGLYGIAGAIALLVLVVSSPGTLSEAGGFWRRAFSQLTGGPGASAAHGTAPSPWRISTVVPLSDLPVTLAPVGESLVVRTWGGGPMLFDGHTWREIAVPGDYVLPPVVGRDGARWIYSYNGAVSVGYELTPAGPLPRDTVRSDVVAAWSDHGNTLLGLADGGVLRGRPGAWVRESTGTDAPLSAILGDSAHQFAVGYFEHIAPDTSSDMLLVFNGLNWSAIDPRPDSSRRWVFNEGTLLNDGTLVLVGQATGGNSRALVAEVAPGALRARAVPGMPESVELQTVVALGGQELWLAGSGTGCRNITCLFRLARDSVEPMPPIGRDAGIVGLSLLRGEVVAMTADGLIWIRRRGDWAYLDTVPGSLADGTIPRLGSWSHATVIRNGVAGVRRAVAVRSQGIARRFWLSDSGRVWIAMCSAGGQCGEADDAHAPGAITDIAPLGQTVVAARGNRVFRYTGHGWEAMQTSGMTGSIVALAGSEKAAAAVTKEALWRCLGWGCQWREWQPVPDAVGRAKSLAITPDGRAAVVLGDLAAVLTGDSLTPVVLEVHAPPHQVSDAIMLPDGTPLLAVHAEDPRVDGAVVVFPRGEAGSRRLPPLNRNVSGLAVDGDTLYVTASGWSTARISFHDLLFRPPL